MIKGKNILITGGGGFIGTNLAKVLIEQNKITALDNGTRDALKYTGLEQHPNFTLVKGDVLDKERMMELVKGKRIILHLAAIAGISSYERFPLKTMEVNLLGTHNMLAAAAKEKPELFLNFSTSEVYGPYAKDVNEQSNTQQGPVGEKRWTYSVSKLAAEHFGFAFFYEHNLRFTSIRPFNIYGPGQVGEGAIQQFAKRALNGEDLIVNGKGDQVRSWCYIDDLVKAVLLMLENRKAIGKTFVIGNPKATVTVKELAEKIVELTKSKSKIRFSPQLKADVQLRIPDITKAKKLLGFEPEIQLEEGLKRTIEWYKSVEGNGQ